MHMNNRHFRRQRKKDMIRNNIQKKQLAVQCSSAIENTLHIFDVLLTQALSKEIIISNRQT